MKRWFVSIICLFAVANLAFAYEVSEAPDLQPWTGVPQESPNAGDAYLITPGIGDAGGFGFAMTDAVNSTIDGATEVVGLTLDNQADVESTDTVIDNGGVNYTLILDVVSTDDLAPGSAGDMAGLFVGGNANGDPVDFPAPAIVSLATVEVFDLAGANAGGPFDITSFGNFTAGPGGGWDGGLGVSFGADSAGNIGGYQLVVDYNMVPDPAAGILLLVGMVALMRRRR